MNATARTALEAALRTEEQHLSLQDEYLADARQRLERAEAEGTAIRARIADLRATLDGAPLVIECTPVDGIV